VRLREAIKNQGYGANRRIARVLGYDEEHLRAVACNERAPSHNMIRCLKTLFPEGVDFDDLIQPSRRVASQTKGGQAE